MVVTHITSSIGDQEALAEIQAYMDELCRHNKNCKQLAIPF